MLEDAIAITMDLGNDTWLTAIDTLLCVRFLILPDWGKSVMCFSIELLKKKV